MIYVTGDIHGSLFPIFQLFKNYNPEANDVVVILGDVVANYDLGSRDKSFKRKMSRFKATPHNAVDR
jgi:3-oxoacid CoA-transferase subunit A